MHLNPRIDRLFYLNCRSEFLRDEKIRITHLPSGVFLDGDVWNSEAMYKELKEMVESVDVEESLQ
mgnify:CR=1 FL=1